jgi:hypothetical protein
MNEKDNTRDRNAEIKKGVDDDSFMDDEQNKQY